MRKNLGSKPILYPQPVLIIGSYDENGIPNAMNAAWGGIAGWHSVFISISRHKTTDNILASGAFTVSIGTADQLAACDYVGLVSANDVPDKMEKSGFHTSRSEFVNAPIIEELPLALECRLISYDAENDYMFGEIINISADETILDENGNISIEKMRPLVFDGGNITYHLIGEKVGIAFHDGKSLK